MKKVTCLISVVFVFSVFSITALAAAPPAGTENMITVGDYPIQTDLEPNTDRLWVSNQEDNTISIVDLKTQTIVETIVTRSKPRDIAFTDSTAYVTCETANVVLPIDLETLTAGTPITVGKQPSFSALSPDQKTLYVSNYDSSTVTTSTVSVINTETNTVVATIPVGIQPSGIVYNPNNDLVYVANRRSHSLSVINAKTNTVIDTISLGDRTFPNVIAADFENNRLYVTAATGAFSCYMIDLTTMEIAGTVPIGSSWGIALSADKSILYATSFSFDKIYVVRTTDPDGMKILAEIDGYSSADFMGVTYNGARNEIYVTDAFNDQLHILSTQLEVALDEPTAIGADHITVTGEATLLSFIENDTAELGVYLSTDASLSPSNLENSTQITFGTGIDHFPYSVEESLQELEQSTTYHIMAYVKSELTGVISYSNVVTATTEAVPEAPEPTFTPVSTPTPTPTSEPTATPPSSTPDPATGIPETGVDNRFNTLFFFVAAGSLPFLLARRKATNK